MNRVAITGAAGRMGRTLVQASVDDAEITLGAALERADSTVLGQDAGVIAGVGELGVAISGSLAATMQDFDVLIDFSVPAATLAAVAACAEHGKGMVIGTTGFDAAGKAAIESAAARIPIMMAPNMSVGVNLTFKLVELAAEILGDEVDVEIIEAHHRDKVDAPSGTALKLGELVAGALGRDLGSDAIYGREGITGKRERRTIAFETIRGGDVVGEHTVMFLGAGERIEITHRASSRMNFARGAMRAVRWLHARPAGLYDMQDVLGL